jgi:hypothetical protein
MSSPRPRPRPQRLQSAVVPVGIAVVAVLVAGCSSSASSTVHLNWNLLLRFDLPARQPDPQRALFLTVVDLDHWPSSSGWSWESFAALGKMSRVLPIR